MEVRQQVIGAFERDYTAYDANGNLTAFTDLRTAANDAYGYDPLNRLVTADGTFGSQAFGYDRNANRLSLRDNATITTYDYAPGSNRLVREGAATVTLDANGNITRQGQRAYTHSPDNRLLSVIDNGTTTATYVYNALGQRVAKTVGGATIRFIYGQNGELLAETDATGKVLRKYIYLNGTPLAVLDSSGVHYLHTDHLGTPRAATDQTGTLVWRWISDPFGTTAANDDPDGDGQTFTLNLRFPGQYFDTETGLHYNYFRYYDPATGRYVTSDPIGLAGGLNTYGYVGGNPVVLSDVLGLDTQYSVGITGTVQAGIPIGPLPFGPGVGLSGGTIVGVNIPDDPTNFECYAFYIQFQANAMVGAGAFAGVGLQAGRTESIGPIKDGSTIAPYVEANAGYEVAVGVSFSGEAHDLPSDISIQELFDSPIEGVSFTPLPKVGVGYGLSAGVGISQVTTYTWYPFGGSPESCAVCTQN